MSYLGFNFGITIAFITGCLLYGQYECNKTGKKLWQEILNELPKPFHLQHVFIGMFFFALFWIVMLIAGWVVVAMVLFGASEKVVLYKGKSNE